MYKIDKTDLQIIQLLMEDGRMPCVDIARRLGNITERAVRYRLNKLISARVIKISAISIPDSLGFDVIADVFVEVEPAMIMEVAHKLCEYECVSYVACSIGQRDISIQVVAHTNAEVYNFLTDIVGKIPGIRKTTTSIVPIILKDVYDWHIPPSSYHED